MPSTPDSPPPRLRPLWVYRVAFIFATGGILYLLYAGRLVAFLRVVRNPAGSPPLDPWTLFHTAVLVSVFLAPLTHLAWELGVQHATARRLNTVVWRGLVEMWRVAWAGRMPVEMAGAFAKRPEDLPTVAVVTGIGTAIGIFALLMTFLARTHTSALVVWIGGASVLFGIITYCHRRAAAYLQDDPRGFSSFRSWSPLNPERYDPEGRSFVRFEIACAAVLAIWWMGGAIVVLR